MSGDYNPNAGCPASFKLLGHVLQKGVELGGLIGVAVVAPGTAAYVKYGRKAEVDVLQLLSNTAWSCAAGAGLSGECMGGGELSGEYCTHIDQLLNTDTFRHAAFSCAFTL